MQDKESMGALFPEPLFVDAIGAFEWFDCGTNSCFQAELSGEEASVQGGAP